MSRERVRRYFVATFDRRAAWWCSRCRKWEAREYLGCMSHNRSVTRRFRTLKQARTHAAALVLSGIEAVCVVERGRRGREWLLSNPGRAYGLDVASSIAWARAYLATPRRKR